MVAGKRASPRRVSHWSSRIKISEPNPGEPIRVVWKNERLNTICCDCDLVHRFSFDVDGEYVVVRAWRDAKMTQYFRKRGSK